MFFHLLGFLYRDQLSLHLEPDFTCSRKSSECLAANGLGARSQDTIGEDNQ